MKSSLSYFPHTLAAELDSIWGFVIAHFVPEARYFADIVQ